MSSRLALVAVVAALTGGGLVYGATRLVGSPAPPAVAPIELGEEARDAPRRRTDPAGRGERQRQRRPRQRRGSAGDQTRFAPVPPRAATPPPVDDDDDGDDD